MLLTWTLGRSVAEDPQLQQAQATNNSQQGMVATETNTETDGNTHGNGLLLLNLAFLLPLIVSGLHCSCNINGCLLGFLLFLPKCFPSDVTIFSWEACGVVLAWFCGCLVLQFIQPGQHAQGPALPNNQRLIYKLNAFALLVTLYIGLFQLTFFTPYLNLGWVYDNFLPLATASTLLSTSLAVYLYVSSLKPYASLSAQGNSGWWWYDFWMGREIHPRIGQFELKQWCSVTPGMIAWAMLNLGMAHKQYTTLGRVTNTMVLVNAVQLLYVADVLWHEQCILSTRIITRDGFGFMLSLWSLTCIPFALSTITRLLVDLPQDASWSSVTCVMAAQLLSYWISMRRRQKQIAGRPGARWLPGASVYHYIREVSIRLRPKQDSPLVIEKAAVWSALETMLQCTKEQIQQVGWDEHVALQLAQAGICEVDDLEEVSREELEQTRIHPALIAALLAAQARAALARTVMVNIRKGRDWEWWGERVPISEFGRVEIREVEAKYNISVAGFRVTDDAVKLPGLYKIKKQPREVQVRVSPGQVLWIEAKEKGDNRLLAGDGQLPKPLQALAIAIGACIGLYYR